MLERPMPLGPDDGGELRVVDLFDNEKDGFVSVRIPAIVATEAGLVLAFAVGRTQVSDWSESKILLRRSADEGLTWTPPQVVAEHAGHVVDNPVPIYDPRRGRIHLLYQTDYNRCYYTYTVDGGDTWLPGEIVVDHSERHVRNPSETVAVELTDGSVLLNIRNESPRYRRAVAVSPNGASHWSPVTFHDELYEPICAAGLVRATDPETGQSVLVFTNPAGKPGETPRKNSPAMPRTNLTVRLSYDEGKTWPVSRR